MRRALLLLIAWLAIAPQLFAVLAPLQRPNAVSIFEASPTESHGPFRDQVGDWLSRDPIGERGGLNLYGYVADDPLSSVDVFGLCGRHEMDVEDYAQVGRAISNLLKKNWEQLKEDVSGMYEEFKKDPAEWWGSNMVGTGTFRGIGPKRPLWTSTNTKTVIKNAFEHWRKHSAEFPEFQNAKQYAEGAQSFLNNPPPGTLTKVRPNGDKLFYDPATNTFGVQAADGASRTMFRPADGINYWNQQ